MNRTIPSLMVLSLILTACGSRQGVPGTATRAEPKFTLGQPEKRPSKITAQMGDTVYGLAYKYGITSRSLIAANGLQPPYKLEIDQELNLPAPQEHVVIEGESARGIAAFYGVDVVVLARENRLSDSFKVQSGDRLIIPAKDTVARDESVSPVGGSVIASSSLAPLGVVPSASADQALGQSGLAAKPTFDISSEIAREKVGSLDLQAELQAEANQTASESAQVAPVSHTPELSQQPEKKSDDDSTAFVSLPPVKAVAAAAGAAGTVMAVTASSSPSSTPTGIPTPIAKPVAMAAAVVPAVTSAPVPASAPVAAVPAAKYIWPAQGSVVSSFGETVNGARNDGINIALPEGSAVQSAAPGEVVYSGNALKGFGNLVLVKHRDGFMTAYGHNSKLLVKKGDAVVQGQKIAESGSTGDVKSPQLHFELRKGTQPIDPKPQLGS